jgi:hypothetical protein
VQISVQEVRTRGIEGRGNNEIGGGTTWPRRVQHIGIRWKVSGFRIQTNVVDITANVAPC